MTNDEALRRNIMIMRSTLSGEYKRARQEQKEALYPSLEFIRARERAHAIQYSIILLDTYLAGYIGQQQEGQNGPGPVPHSCAAEMPVKRRYPTAVCTRPSDEKCPMDDKIGPSGSVSLSDCIGCWCPWYNGGLEWWALGR